MKKMGSSHTVPPPEARHSASTASTSIAVEATLNHHQRTGGADDDHQPDHCEGGVEQQDGAPMPGSQCSTCWT